MKSLSIFQAPNDGEITLCELDGKLHSANYEFANISTFTTVLNNHPKIHITRDMSYNSGNDAKSLFLPVHESFLKHLIQIYYEQGFTEVLYYIKEHGPYLMRTGTATFLTVINKINSIRRFLNRNAYDSNLTLVNSISQTRNWKNNLIRCIAWHEQHVKIAIATADDCVRIYSSCTNVVPLLKCKDQKLISCIAWRPLSNSDIAVGCETGIFVWNVDVSLVITRPSISSAIVLYRVEHKPVVSLSWNPQGNLLASTAALDSNILVWNVELDETTSLKRCGCNGNSLLRWSPNGKKLFSATTGPIFRMWDCQTWQEERWNLLGGSVQTACWSPCGNIILFATKTEPFIYALSFIQSELVFTFNSKNSPNKAVPVYDVTKIDIDDLIVGGIIRSMEWDSKGNYLAVLFEDTSYIAVFKVTVYPVLQLNPGFLIAGTAEEQPVTIAFQNNFEYGACLSIGWSSGRLQYFPIIFSEASSPNKVRGRNCNNSTLHTSFDIFQSSNLSF